MTPKDLLKKELTEAIKNRPVTHSDVEAFEERCRIREKEFERMERRMRPDSAWYSFRYGCEDR